MKTLRRIVVLVSAAALGAGAFAGTASALPNTMIHGGPSGTTSARTASFHLMGVNGAVRIQCKLNRGAWFVCVRTASGQKTFRNLARRSHTLLVRGVDRRGRVDPTPARRTWRVR
jgi:large repetitive protein